jgi:hypothetical protein
MKSLKNSSNNSQRTQVATLTQTPGEAAPKKQFIKVPSETQLNQKWENLLEKTIEQKDTSISDSLYKRIDEIIAKSII